MSDGTTMSNPILPPQHEGPCQNIQCGACKEWFCIVCDKDTGHECDDCTYCGTPCYCWDGG